MAFSFRTQCEFAVEDVLFYLDMAAICYYFSCVPLLEKGLSQASPAVPVETELLVHIVWGRPL